MDARHILLQQTLIAAAAALLALTAAPCGAVETTTLHGHRLLLISTAQDKARTLAGVLRELYRAEVTIKEPRRYDPGIDEFDYDGFVYLGADYFAPPKPGLLDDVRRTRKPVLWIGYHAWQLDPGFLAGKALTVHDRRRGPLATVAAPAPLAMMPAEATVVDAPAEAVLYWLADAAGERTPGAVRAGNLTLIAYVPAVDPYAAEFAPLLQAIRSAFGDAVAPRSRPRPDYAARVAAARKDRFRTGVHLPVYVAQTTEATAGYDADRWHANLLRIRHAGAEWVNLVRTHYLQNVTDSTVAADAALTPTFDALANIVADAHRLGLLVRLHMAVDLRERSPVDWHGVIRPADRQQWWASFGARLRELAEFARRHEVESIVLGTELTTMQRDGAQWRRLIDTVRKDVGYGGLIGYAVNYNSPDADWLEALDFFSVSAYWPLAQTRDPDLPTLLRSWRDIDEVLRRWKSAHPAVALELGEIGYVSQPYASVLPFSWRSYKGEQQSLNEQLRCYESVREFLAGATYVGGVHFFASTAEDDDPRSLGYTPFGKPAEQVLKAVMRMR